MFEQQMKSFRNQVITLCMVLLFSINASPCLVQAENSNIEYKLKAAFILNFSKFTNWPENAFSEESKFFQVCIVGQDPFGLTIAGLESKELSGRRVQLNYPDLQDGLESCHAVFIGKSEEQNIEQILYNIDGLPILTISDIENFAEQGGMFEFIRIEKKLSFIINNQQASSNGLQVSSALLNLAAKVL